MIPSLETARLRLEPLELADAGQIQILFPHWEIVRHLASVVPWPYLPDGALTYWFNTLKFPVLCAPKAIANIATRVGEAGHAHRRHRGTRLRVRTDARRDPGDYRGGMEPPSQNAWLN